MYLRKDSLRACAGLLGIEDLYGVQFTDHDFLEERAEEVWSELVSSEILEQVSDDNGNSWRVSNLGQMIINMMASPDIWLSAYNINKGLKRTIYLKNVYYLYIEEKDDIFMLNFLPTLELVIGAFSEVLEGIDESGTSPEISIQGDSLVGPISIEFTGSNEAFREINYQEDTYVYSEESCTNDISQWLLKGLKEVNTYG